MASISAWAEGSRSSRGRLPAAGEDAPVLTIDGADRDLAAPRRLRGPRRRPRHRICRDRMGLTACPSSALFLICSLLPLLCYQAPMTDSNDDDRRGRPRRTPDRGRTSGDRPFRKSREGDERPSAPAATTTARASPARPATSLSAAATTTSVRRRFEGGDQASPCRGPRAPSEGDKPFPRARSRRGGKPFRARERRDEGRPPLPRAGAGDERPSRARFDRTRRREPHRAREERPAVPRPSRRNRSRTASPR